MTGGTKTVLSIWRPLWELPQRWELILSLARREVAARYKGSFLGVLWAVLTPLAMIAIFTFIFSGIFGAKFGTAGTTWDYALYLFCGLLAWNAFQEAVQLSATSIVENANLVKRVVFPLETLPLAKTLAALVNQLLGTLVLLFTALLAQQTMHPTILWLPVLLAPQIMLTLGAAWFIASLGVYVRDIVQGVGLALTVWLYLTPIIYPETAVPEKYRAFVNLNPFTALARCYRNILLEGKAPDWAGLGYFTVFALVVFLAGYWWFARTRKGFADVV
jgi:lipopolysaccharide transport system permease protein